MTRDEVTAILSNVSFDTWRFLVGVDGERLYLQVETDAACAITNKPMVWSGRKWMLSAFMTRSEVVQTAFKAVLTALEHEARERFRYRGRPIFGPHFNVDRLAELYDTPGALEVRE